MGNQGYACKKNSPGFWTETVTHFMNSQHKTVRLSELPWSRSTTVVNTLSKDFKRWNQTIKIWLNLNNIKWFEDVFNNTSPIHNVTLLCPQLVLKHHTDVHPLKRLKIIQMLLLPPTKPHHSFSPHQSQSGEVTLRLANTFHPFVLLSWRPIPDSTASVLSTVLRAGGGCMMGVVGKAERQREACPRGRGSGITWFHSMSSVSVPAGTTWTRMHAVRHLNSEWPLDFQTSVNKTSRHHLQSCRRLWTGSPGALTLPQDHPVSLLSPTDFPWCCATRTKHLFIK